MRTVKTFSMKLFRFFQHARVTTSAAGYIVLPAAEP